MKCTSLLTGLLAAAGSVGPALAFTNPIRRPGGSDPFVTYSGDGYYYMTTTTWDNVQIARSRTIEGLKTAERKVVYQSTDPSRCCNVWAPEIHWMGDRWFVYFTAGNGANLEGQRPHVLRGPVGGSPWDGFEYAGVQMSEWAIDATVLRTSQFGNFLVSSCQTGGRPQSLCIQRLNADHVGVSGPLRVISEPDQAWERSGVPVQEGPAALYAGGRTRIVYSASYCWTAQYCLGSLTWDGRTDPTARAAWTKSSGCLLASGAGHYGTGHNSFFGNPDGSQHYIAYHATSNPSGACDDSRYAMIQQVDVAADGSLRLGPPVSFNANIPEPR